MKDTIIESLAYLDFKLTDLKYEIGKGTTKSKFELTAETLNETNVLLSITLPVLGLVLSVFTLPHFLVLLVLWMIMFTYMARRRMTEYRENVNSSVSRIEIIIEHLDTALDAPEPVRERALYNSVNRTLNFISSNLKSEKLDKRIRVIRSFMHSNESNSRDMGSKT